MIHGRKDVKIRELTSEKTVYLCFNCEKRQAKSEKKKRKRMDDIKKQLEIVFSMNTSTLKMAMEHFKLQQLIVENNKLKEEIQLQSKKQ